MINSLPVSKGCVDGDWKSKVIGNIILQFLLSFVSFFVQLRSSEAVAFFRFVPTLQLLFTLFCLKEMNSNTTFHLDNSSLAASLFIIVYSTASLVYLLNFSCLSSSSCIHEDKMKFSALLEGLVLLLEVI